MNSSLLNGHPASDKVLKLAKLRTVLFLMFVPLTGLNCLLPSKGLQENGDDVQGNARFEPRVEGGLFMIKFQPPPPPPPHHHHHHHHRGVSHHGPEQGMLRLSGRTGKCLLWTTMLSLIPKPASTNGKPLVRPGSPSRGAPTCSIARKACA
eukprot:467329-Amphidinium_carterae.1